MPGYTSKPSSVYYTLKKYVDAAEKFESDTKLGFTVKKEEIPPKSIELAIPPNPTEAQLQQLQRAIDYANQHNINLNVRTVK
jgi:hypothetical protein